MKESLYITNLLIKIFEYFYIHLLSLYFFVKLSYDYVKEKSIMKMPVYMHKYHKKRKKNSL